MDNSMNYGGQPPKIKTGSVYRMEHQKLRERDIKALKYMKELELKLREEDKLHKFLIKNAVIETTHSKEESPVINALLNDGGRSE